MEKLEDVCPKKETKRRTHAFRTGGGFPLKVYFSTLEEDLLEFFTPEAVSLGNIPQEKFDAYENITEPNVDNENITEPNLDNENIIEPDLDNENTTELDPQKISCKENENQPPQKRLYKNCHVLNTNRELKTQSLSPNTIHTQEKVHKSIRHHHYRL